MCHPKGRVFAPFWSKDFVLFGLESGMVFKGTTESIRTYLFEFEMDFKKSFLLVF